MPGPRKAPKATRRKLPKVITGEEAHALLEQPNLGCPTGMRDRCILELLYRAGLRVSETLALELRDYRPKDSQLHLRPEITKGNVEAYLYLEPQTCQLIDVWIKTYRRPLAQGSKLLFVTHGGKPIDRKDAWKMVVRRADRGGIERHVHPHMLRHSYATELLAEGFSLREVQELMRHSDIRTTSAYLHVSNSVLRDKVRARQRASG